MADSLKVSLVGASGYSGAEVVSLFLQHPRVKIEKLFASSSAGKRLDEVFPRFTGRLHHTLEPYSAEAACSSDVVFLALPSGEAMNIVPELLDRGKRVIDLGGDFRLKDPQEYERFYKHTHTSPQLLPKAVYGLSEWNASAIRNATLVANPGCYPTSALIPLLPALKESIVRRQGIAINSLSGVSGAGRKASLELSFAEVNESVTAYKVGVHQHIPEITSVLTGLTGAPVSVSFVPHLLPITRGIFTTIYAPLEHSVTSNHINDLYGDYYGNKPFIRVLSDGIPAIRNVAYTNYIDIGFSIDAVNNLLILFSAIDNLVKGSAGQAVQNMNLMYDYPETEGLV